MEYSRPLCLDAFFGPVAVLGIKSLVKILSPLEVLVGLVEVFHGLLLHVVVFEGLQSVELGHRVYVQGIHAIKSLLSYGLLVVGNQKSPKILLREEVLTLVAKFGHGENVNVVSLLVVLRTRVLVGETLFLVG